MKKVLFCAAAVLALASCSNDSLVSDSPANNEAPIAFNVGQKNITRAEQALELAGYNDFGVWAYKYTGSTAALVMNNYKVAHKEENSATVWYYDGVIDGQVIRYWDHSTDNTNFYAYAPYNSVVSFVESSKTINVTTTAGYEKTQDFIYAGASVVNANYDKNVKLQFKHIGAIVKVAFRESVSGYKVQLIDVKDDTENGKGIQATPAIETVSETDNSKSYSVGSYNTTSTVTIDYTNPASPDATTSTTGATTSSDNLKFTVPTKGITSYTAKDVNSTKYNVLPESDYAESSTIYYAVVQPVSTTGFTIHVSYKLIAEDNGEVITVRDARVFIPASQVQWESNKSYTYNFTITTNSTGNTDGTVDVTKPEVPTDKALNPIVFDGPTIVDYTLATTDANNI